MKRFISLISVLAITICMFSACLTAHSAEDGFVYANGTHFYLNGKTFYTAGCNSYNLFRIGNGSTYGQTEEEVIYNTIHGFMDTDLIDNCMAEMASCGINVCRTWAFSSDSWHGFEEYKNGKWNYIEAQFLELDYIVKSAKEHGIKLILVLENYWEAFGGIDAKLNALGLPSNGYTARRAYFTNETCKQWYKEYAQHLINRTNYFTGVKYKDDTTIFAWDLMNEPRYELSMGTDSECVSGTTLRAWVDEMGAYIKSIDKNHMVFVGLEGHGSQYGFGGNSGNPFVYIQQSPYIDFCSAHPYPDEQWANLSPAQTKTLVERWISDAHNVVVKPFMITEFNVISKDKQESYWKAVCDTVYEKDAGGVLFWDFETTDSLKDHRFYVNSASPIMTYFKQHSAQMLAKNGTSDPNPPINTDTEIASTDTEFPSTDTEIPSTDTEIPSTDTEIPSTDTEIPSTDTEIPSTDTEIPSTDTEIPSTDTEILSTDTEISSTDTEIPSTDTEIPSTDTEIPSTDTDTETDTDNIILGDVNSDGIVDIIDVVLTRADIIGTSKLSVEALLRADINSDTVIDIIDIALMRNKIING